MTEAELLGVAYEMLLRLPHRAVRQRLQQTLCTLRDEIARLTGKDPQEVQNEFEVLAETSALRGDKPNG